MIKKIIDFMLWISELGIVRALHNASVYGLMSFLLLQRLPR